MKYNFRSTKELAGCYIASSWNGMRDIYKVTKYTPKSIELTEVKWRGDLERCSDDPTWRPCKIKFNDSNPVFETVLGENGKPEAHKVKKIVKFDEDDYIKKTKDWLGWTRLQ